MREVQYKESADEYRDLCRGTIGRDGQWVSCERYDFNTGNWNDDDVAWDVMTGHIPANRISSKQAQDIIKADGPAQKQTVKGSKAKTGPKKWQLGCGGCLGVCLLIVIITAVAGSGGNSTKSITSSNNSESATEASTDSTIKTATPASSDDTTIDEQVIFDANDVKITAVEYSTAGLFGDSIKVLIENNGTSNVGIGCDALIVNDYMITDLFSEQVAAGKKSNETIDLYTSQLKAAGIDMIGKVEVRFHLYDPDTYMTTYTSDLVEIQTNHYADMDTTPNDDGQELYNNGGIRIVGKYVDENSFWGNGIVLYLENNSEQNVTVQVNDMSINGYMMSPIFSSTVYAHKKAIDDITIFQSDLDQNGITSVDDVELTFHIFDPDTFSTITDSDVVSFSTK